MRRQSMGEWVRIQTVLKTIGRHANVHICLTAVFAFTWFLHYMAAMRMAMSDRQFTVPNSRTMRTMALIDLVDAHYGLAIAYAILTFAAVAFLQIRGRPSWTCWLAGAVFGVPCVVYWFGCAYIAVGKLV